MKISLQQIRLIHTAKTKLGLSEDSYREMLSSFCVSSSKDLTADDAKKLMKTFEGLGFKPVLKEPKYNKLGKRDERATPKQLRKIEAMWKNSSRVRDKSDEALRRFIKRIAGVDRLEWLLINSVQKVIKAIENLV
mgnify:CR=1 FL=1